MPDGTPAATPESVPDLVRQAPLSFVGRVTRLGGTPLAAVTADERTAVVQVDEVLHAPDAFRRLAGSEVTVQLSAGLAPPAVGDRAAFFTKGAVYGEGLAVDEVGRLPADDVQPHLTLAATTADAMPFSAVLRGIRDEDMTTHAGEADAVVIGTVVGLEKLPGNEGRPISEHDPDWWRAQLDVSHVESGDVPRDGSPSSTPTAGTSTGTGSRSRVRDSRACGSCTPRRAPTTSPPPCVMRRDSSCSIPTTASRRGCSRCCRSGGEPSCPH